MAIEFVEAQDEFGLFLKALRERIPPETVTLGPWKRLPVRRGRRVTQEEVAEAVGVSRNWYRRLEAGAVRASMKLLSRLANTFTFTPEERAKLFVLALPEIGIVALPGDSGVFYARGATASMSSLISTALSTSTPPHSRAWLNIRPKSRRSTRDFAA